MNIENIIKEDTTKVDIDKLELPESMQQATTPNTEAVGNNKSPEGDSTSDGGTEGTTKLSLEQLAGMIVLGYNVVSCAIYRKIEPTFDASLTPDETKALQEPLETVLREYNVEVTPITALAVAVVSVNVVKIMQLQAYRKQLAEQVNYTEQPQNDLV